MVKKNIITAALITALSAAAILASCGPGNDVPVTSGVPASVTYDVSRTEPYPVKLPETRDEVGALLWLLSTDADAVKNDRSDLIELAYIGYCALSEEERGAVPYADAIPALREEAARSCVTREYADTRIDHSKLLFGAYCAHVGKPENVTDIKDCGMDFVWSCGGNLDIFAEQGIGVIDWVSAAGIPFRWDPDSSTAEYEATIVANKADHPALWGLYQNDEPTVYALDIMKENSDIIKKHFPDVAIVENLLPGDDSETAQSWYGDVDYRTYIETFIEHGLSDVVCYDRYLYDSPGTIVTALKNLRVVSETVEKHGMEFWLIAGVYGPDSGLSTEQMKFQGYTAMAYGVTSVSYACWSADGWSTTVLNSGGKKTKTYYALKDAVLDMKPFSPVYMKYAHRGTALIVGDGYLERTDFFPSPAVRKEADGRGFSTLNSVLVTSMKVSDSDFAAVGRFEKKAGRAGEGFFVVNCSDYSFRHETEATVSFTVSDDVSLVTVYEKGVPRVLAPADGVYSVTAYGADAVFVTVE